MLLKHLFTLMTLSMIAFNAMAAEPVAREETTPPRPEGALTAQQIPPLSNMGKPISKPMAPSSTLTTPPPVPASPPPPTIHNPPPMPPDQLVPIQ